MPPITLSINNDFTWKYIRFIMFFYPGDQMISLLDQIILLLNTNYQNELKEESEQEAFFFG